MTTALMLVDVQRNMLEGDTPVPDADAVRANLEMLLARARDSGAVVVHVQNDGPPGDPDEPGTPGWDLVLPTADGELLVGKDQSNTFAANEGLAGQLRSRGVDRVLVAGMQSNYCIAATSRGALTLGFQVVLPSGAHATYDEDEPAAAISARIESELAAEGVTVIAASKVSLE